MQSHEMLHVISEHAKGAPVSWLMLICIHSLVMKANAQIAILRCEIRWDRFIGAWSMEKHIAAEACQMSVVDGLVEPFMISKMPMDKAYLIALCF